ncbi:MAG: caspase family protein, partial [Thermodesulfovibrionales bacterium]|nr:caspase family protein [Thermodesulfovibrionales bacterium]
MRSVKIKEKTEISPTTTKSKGEVFNDCKEIEAVSGENEISVTAFNKDNTVQGYMQTAKFISAIKQEEPRLYILSIGIDQYKDNTINLKYAVKDSKDIKEKILKQAETLYKPENIHHIALKDIEATKSNITAKINMLSQKIKPTDSFILFVAGHGVLLQNQYYMLTHEYDGKVNGYCQLFCVNLIKGQIGPH